jgi:lipoprotein-anchoring transpeptidase ErfK/SrfK
VVVAVVEAGLAGARPRAGIFNGAGVRGSDETWSIRRAVSHGCLGMTIASVIDLYRRVTVGTPIYIGD